jgi:trigger factor
MATETSTLKIAIEEPRAWARRLKITVPAERVARERSEASRRLAQRLKLPGFRKGKIPPHVIEKRFGGALEQEAVEKVVGAAYREALEQEQLHPITQGEIGNLEYEPGTELSFDVEFEIRPVLELERLGGFTVKRERAAVDEAEVDAILERLRQEQAVWEGVEGEQPATGDMALVEMTALEGEGATAAESAARRYRVVLGEAQAPPAVEAALQGLEPGGETEVEVESEGGAEGEAAAPDRWRVKLVEVKRPRLPELDDEFAKSVGDFEELAALRARVREDLEREADAEADRQVRRALLGEIVEANPFEVPDSMVDRYLERLLQVREDAEAERVAEMKAAARPVAEEAIKRMLVIERVAELEGLHATADEVQERVAQIAERRGRPPQEVRAQLAKAGRLEALEEEVTEEKAFRYLESLSTVE